MIKYERFQFAAPPLTAVGWFLDATRVRYVHRHRALEPFDGGCDKLRVSLVMDPYRWLHRIYVAGSRKALSSSDLQFLPAIPGCAGAPVSFEDFVWQYINTTPTAISECFARYEADVCLRVEDLPWSFCEFLDGCGVPIPHPLPSLPNMTPPINPELQNLVASAEREFYGRYEYY